MQFFDVVKVQCTSGTGGDGCVAARREKYVPYGGPSGGNGGKGGSVILRGDAQLTTLATLHAQKHIKAPHGEAGKIKEQYGADAEDVIVPVPVGTLVRDDQDRVVAYINEVGQEEVLLAGGRGGIGNMHFSNSVMQYANFGLHGEPGQTQQFVFELLLLADVALLGFPSVGKTSLLNTVSAAAAKTAEYHFTTLIPNLGVVRSDPSFVMIDVPGLIEGAAGGKGLGNEFLRHVMKARVRCLVADVSVYENGISMIMQLIDEISIYLQTIVYKDREIAQSLINTKEGNIIWSVIDTTTGEKILLKQCLFVGNKIDLVGDKEILQEWETTLRKQLALHPLWKNEAKKGTLKGLSFVSAGSREGVEDWIQTLQTILRDAEVWHHPDEHVAEKKAEIQRTRTQIAELEVRDLTAEKLDWLIENQYLEEKERKYVYVREVKHPEMSYLTFVIPRGNDEAELRYRRVLEKKQILKHLERVGVKKGDVFLVKSPYLGKDDRWIRRA